MSDESTLLNAYPASRTLYLYVNRRYLGNSLFDRLLAAYLLPLNLYGSDPAGWGFIALDAAERAEVQATLKRYSDFRY